MPLSSASGLRALRRRSVLGALAGAGVAATTRRAGSAGVDLRVITSGSDTATRLIVEAMAQKFSGFQASADVHALAQRRGPAVFAALGPGALQNALDVDLGGPLLSLFVSNEAFARTVEAAPRRSRGPVTAIYAEAAPGNQMQLIRALYARRVSVGVLVSDATARQESALRRAARLADLDVDLQLVEPGENVLRALTRVSAAHVLLTIPDRGLYTADNLRGILESTYRRNQGVIGFSASLVTAGTLAAAYSSIDDILAQVAELAPTLAAGRVPDPQYPAYWRVAVNDSVARSLNVVVSDAARNLGNRPS